MSRICNNPGEMKPNYLNKIIYTTRKLKVYKLERT